MILVIWASPNENGLTAAAKDKILDGISVAGVEAETIHLNKCEINRCITCEDGWGLCRSEGRCVIQDDFTEVYDKIISADGIVFVTPVYWHDLAECLKTFLDRLRRCETAHNHNLRDKVCMLVACAGGTGNGAIQCLERLEETLGHMGLKIKERLPIIQFNKGYMLPALCNAGTAFALHIYNNNAENTAK